MRIECFLSEQRVPAAAQESALKAAQWGVQDVAVVIRACGMLEFPDIKLDLSAL